MERGVNEPQELLRNNGSSTAQDMRVGLLCEEQRVAEQEIERKTKDILERLKNATEELKSLETDTMIERNVLGAAEARAGIARRKIHQYQLIIL